MYARVRIVDTGILTPWPGVDLTAPPPEVRFRIICEPLLLGVLPQTLLPTVIGIVAVVLASSMLVGPVNQYLAVVVDEARADIAKDKAE
jgi:hypothetical protein